jgi:uncharacterized protein (DUF4415 family)
LDPKHPPKLTAKQKARLDAMGDAEIDYSDIPELDERFLRLANALTPVAKRSVTVRLDEDVYRWLKGYGGGYQSRLNAMLKAMMLIQDKRV